MAIWHNKENLTYYRFDSGANSLICSGHWSKKSAGIDIVIEKIQKINRNPERDDSINRFPLYRRFFQKGKSMTEKPRFKSRKEAFEIASTADRDSQEFYDAFLYCIASSGPEVREYFFKAIC